MQMTLLSSSVEHPCTPSQSFSRRLFVWYSIDVIGLNQSTKDGNSTIHKEERLKGLKEPAVSGHTLQLTAEVKYLGLTLDKGLTWNAQSTGLFGPVRAHLVKLGV
jgi:hypothetical protein